MTKLKLLGAAAILSSALAAPAMAQQVVSNPGYCAQFYPNANCQNKGVNNPYTGDYQRRAAYQNNGDWDNDRSDRGNWSNARASYDGNRWDRNRGDNDSGFWPADVAAGVVGGAVGTAGAIATAPFRGNSYAYDTGPAPIGGEAYARQNGFVCMPGTYFRGEDGRRHICQ